VLRLSSTPVVSIAKIRGRTRGIGNEFVLACDMRFASRQSAILGNPEIGVGLVPGSGALEWLPRLVGRSRALEIVLSGDDFDADIAERYGWVNRTLDDDDLDSLVDALVRRLALFDREALAAAKAQINRFQSRQLPSFSRATTCSSQPCLAQCAGAPCQGPQYRLRCSERLRIELRPVPPCTRAGGRR
jgi:enoyl-CoA hydratase/carnithine racemase